jgi:serine/threonine protein phosphatase PrpC
MDVQTASDAYRVGGGVAKKAFKKQKLMHKELSNDYWDTLQLPPNKYETILLSTDGVHDNLGYQELIGLVAECNGEHLAQIVAEKAYLYSLLGEPKSKPDDITALVVSLA